MKLEFSLDMFECVFLFIYFFFKAVQEVLS